MNRSHRCQEDCRPTILVGTIAGVVLLALLGGHAVASATSYATAARVQLSTATPTAIEVTSFPVTTLTALAASPTATSTATEMEPATPIASPEPSPIPTELRPGDSPPHLVSPAPFLPLTGPPPEPATPTETPGLSAAFPTPAEGAPAPGEGGDVAGGENLLRDGWTVGFGQVQFTFRINREGGGA